MKHGSLPPLKWLRAFEAAGRLGSFKSAAASLNVTPSTISHQVRDLEAYLGVPLFERSSRQMVLTEEGQQYLTPLTAAFELIESAGDHVGIKPEQLRIGAFPFLLHEVLTPNTTILKKLLGIERLSLHAETSLSSLVQANPDNRLDVVVRYSSGTEPGFIADKISDVELVPIQAADQKPITTLEELLVQPVVRILSPFDAWTPWQEAHGVSATNQQIALETDSYHSGIYAVSQGQGICLGIIPFINPWLREDRIRALDQYRVSIREGAYAVYAPHNRDHPTLPQLTDWLRNTLR